MFGGIQVTSANSPSSKTIALTKATTTDEKCRDNNKGGDKAKDNNKDGKKNCGDDGPGGGIVFYVSVEPFVCGSELQFWCRYLEAAPNTWYPDGSGSADPALVWSGNTSTSVTTGTAIGTGYSNTLAIVGQSGGGSTADRAATASRAYRGGGKSDWFLPSKDELNELCKYANTQTTGTATPCSNGTQRVGFTFGGVAYWSSSEAAADYAADYVQNHYFANWGQGDNFKSSSSLVRPVRAF